MKQLINEEFLIREAHSCMGLDFWRGYENYETVMRGFPALRTSTMESFISLGQ